MKPEQLNELRERLGFTPLGAGAFGLANGFPVFIPNIQTIGNALIKIKTDRIPNKDDVKMLNERLRPFGGKISGSGQGGPGLGIEYKAGKNAVMSPSDFILQATSILGSSGYYPEDRCLICGGPGCDAAALHGNTFGTVHHSCLDLKVYEAQSADETDSDSSNVALGIIGALLGMIVGTLPSLLTILLTERIFLILYALMPVCAYYGYKKFGGKMKGKTALIVSIVAAVLGVFVLILEGDVFYLMHDMGHNFTAAMQVMKRVMRSPSFWGESISSNVTSFLFAGLGILYSWKLISQTTGTALQKAKGISAYAYRYPQTTSMPQRYSESELSSYQNDIPR